MLPDFQGPWSFLLHARVGEGCCSSSGRTEGQYHLSRRLNSYMCMKLGPIAPCPDEMYS
jgi:hypothetical protein